MHLRVASKNDPPQGLLLASNLVPTKFARSVGLIGVWIPNPSKALYHGGAYGGTTIVGSRERQRDQLRHRSSDTPWPVLDDGGADTPTLTARRFQH